MDEKEIKNNSARSDIKSIHTYTSDMADAIRENEASVIKIALAEKEKRERETIYKEAEGTKSSKFFLLLGGVILVGGAILGSYFLFKKSTVAPETKTTVKDIDTLISFDQKAFIDATDARIQTDLYALIKDELTKEAPLLSVKALILTEDLGDGKRLLEKINRYGTTVLLTTHNKEIVDKLKRRVVTIKDGKIADDRAGSEYRL
jgi:apolipoprotein N-acyltransferase